MPRKLSGLPRGISGEEVTGSTPVFSTNKFKSPGSFDRAFVWTFFLPPKSIFLMKFFVYILFSKVLDRYYVGYTGNLEDRMRDHQSGISTYTSKADDWVLVYSEEYASREEARAREKAIKKKKSRKYIEWLVNGKK